MFLHRFFYDAPGLHRRPGVGPHISRPKGCLESFAIAYPRRNAVLGQVLVLQRLYRSLHCRSKRPVRDRCLLFLGPVPFAQFRVSAPVRRRPLIKHHGRLRLHLLPHFLAYRGATPPPLATALPASLPSYSLRTPGRPGLPPNDVPAQFVLHIGHVRLVMPRSKEPFPP